MSRNLESARRFFPSERTDIVGLFRRDDAVEILRDRFGEVFHDDFETVDVSGSVTPAGTGMAGYVAGWREWLNSFASWAVVVEDLAEVGDRVLVTLDILARSRTGGVEIPSRAANVLVFRDGRIATVELHTSVDEARRAAGLEA